jgi:RNA polymerase sigma-70 factor (ECF subfamily)
MTDEELLASAHNKDDEAFEVLMRRYIKPLFYFAKQYVGDDAAAEDITQETFFKAWRNIGKFKTGKTFRPWVYTIARNTALDYIKKKRAVAFSELDDLDKDDSFADTVQDTAPLPIEIFEQVESAEQLESAMQALHPDHRTTLIMHYYEELTFDEIAIVMGKPLNTVKSWHRRSLSKLKGLIRTKNRS